ncbi:restriction endonuclease subunit M [Pseudoxanthomonas jiangsuensis]|uniref:DNA adenine methylase n=1 Tax=Pseudoxanthomonas jiangsuensis TaxID=619688 RepID=UPI001391A157|nr:DNA adenine methylase [Pseudoxanthomonas jiangsuensis]KAF1692773.1 restriction endonuclease subunit M [Pseudoxanthomonas jiangsuensis]
MKTKTLIPWPGGKSRLAAQLLPLFDNTHKTYVEPFAGAAAMLFLRPEPAKVEVLNDAQRDLITLYRVVQHHLDEFVRQFRWQLVARDEFQRLLQAEPDTLTDIQRAARFFYLQKTCFGGKVRGRQFGVDPGSPARLNLLRLEEDLSDAYLRLSRVVIENLDWQACMQRYDTPATFFFADPPYWQTEGYGNPFGLDQYQALAEVMRRAKGRVLVTINDHPDMREVFAGFRLKRLATTYTIGRSAASKGQRRYELAVRSW